MTVRALFPVSLCTNLIRLMIGKNYHIHDSNYIYCNQLFFFLNKFQLDRKDNFMVLDFQWLESWKEFIFLGVKKNERKPEKEWYTYENTVAIMKVLWHRNSTIMRNKTAYRVLCELDEKENALPVYFQLVMGIVGNVLAVGILWTSRLHHQWRSFYIFFAGLVMTDLLNNCAC